MKTTNVATPCKRAIGRALACARNHCNWPQYALARITGIDNSVISRIELGLVTTTPLKYAMIRGALAAKVGRQSPSVENFVTTLEMCYANPPEPRWIAATPEALAIQRRALRDEIKCASAVSAVWPYSIPDHLQTSEPDEGWKPDRLDTSSVVTLAISEAILKQYALVGELHEQLNRTSWGEGKDIDIHVIPATVAVEYELGYALTIVTTKEGDTFAHADMRNAGIFFHLPEDVDPLQRQVEQLIETSRTTPLMHDPDTR